MARKPYLSKLSDRQIKSFTMMYNNLEYPTADIAKRFGISTATVNVIAHELKLNIRPSGR